MAHNKGSMAGYIGGTTARIQQRGAGYDNKSLRRVTKHDVGIRKVVAPASIRSLRTHTMNHVFNYRLSNNPIAQDTWLSKLI